MSHPSGEKARGSASRPITAVSPGGEATVGSSSTSPHRDSSWLSRETGDGLEPSLPRALFDAGVADPVIPEYCVTKDGQRFLVIVPAEQSGRSLNVILSWPSLLE